jgi:hypothetical protein
LALATVAAGLWVGGVFYQEVEAHKARISLAEKVAPLAAQPRNLGHMIGGGSIVVFTMILAALGHWWPRKKWMLSVFAALLAMALVAQVWVGVLLMFDGSNRASSVVRLHSAAAQMR